MDDVDLKGQLHIKPKNFVIEIYETNRRSGSDCLAVYGSPTPFMAIKAGDLIVSNEYRIASDGASLRVVEVEHMLSPTEHKLMIYVEPA